MWRVSPKRYRPEGAARSRAERARRDPGELVHRPRAAAADVEHLVVGARVLEHEQVRVDDVVDVDEIAHLQAVFVDRGLVAEVEREAEHRQAPE
jgi:hypothetical protein